jgi:hypothetical protein
MRRIREAFLNFKLVMQQQYSAGKPFVHTQRYAGSAEVQAFPTELIKRL